MKEKKHIEFVIKIKKILPEIKILDEYKSNTKKILVEDELGLKYSVFPTSLLNGIKPTIKTSVDTEEFIKITILNKNNLKYISGFTSYSDRIYVKDDDDIVYYSQCADLLRKDLPKPSLKTAVDPNDGFIKKSKKIHGNFYDYSLIDYKDTIQLISIKCPIHGVFKQKPSNHLRGCGCPKCGEIRTIKNLTTNHIGWTLEKWKSVGLRKKGKPIVYIVKIFSDNEAFIKIGRTYQDINDRFKFLKSIFYNFEVIKIVEGEYDFIYNEEQELLKKYKKYSYIPKIKFNGYKECFKEDIIKFINENK